MITYAEMSVVASSLTVLKGSGVLGRISMALRLERYTLATMKEVSSHRPATNLTDVLRGSHTAAVKKIVQMGSH